MRCHGTYPYRLAPVRLQHFQGFSIGSFVDEIAHAKGADPRDVWLEILGPPRQMSLADLGVQKMPNYGQPLDKYPVDVGRLRNVIERVTARHAGPSAGKMAVLSASLRTGVSSATRPWSLPS